MDKTSIFGSGLPTDKSHKVFSIEDKSASTGPYNNRIVEFLRTIVSGAKMNGFADILNAMEEAFYGSGEIRYGSKPNADHISAVRTIVGKYMTDGKPVPVLVPWGSIKGKFGANVDMAEVSAINQMIALYNRVTKFYTPGVEFVIRVEDTSGLQLFELDDKTGDVPKQIAKYVADFRALVCIMDYTESIGVVPESEMPESGKFYHKAHANIKFFDEYLKESDELIAKGVTDEVLMELPSYKVLADLGWKGIISPVQRSYYYSTYRKLYYSGPAMHSEAEVIDGSRYRLALYLAQSLTRKALAMTGVQNRWFHGHVQVTFVPPVPGLPYGYDMNSIYYRTMPESHCRTHGAPWRMKGYLLIKDTDLGFTIKSKLATWSETKEYYTAEVELKNATMSVTVSVDYLLETSK